MFQSAEMTDEMAQKFLLLEKLPSYFLIAASVMSATGSIIILLAFIYLCRINYCNRSSRKVAINDYHYDVDNNKKDKKKRKNRLPNEVPRDDFLLTKSLKPSINYT